MSSLDLDLDAHMNNLETEWRQHTSPASLPAPAIRRSQPARRRRPTFSIRARERLDRTEALKARIMPKIERLEDTMLGQD